MVRGLEEDCGVLIDVPVHDCKLMPAQFTVALLGRGMGGKKWI